MALYQIKAPDGNTYRIEGPDGASQEDVVRAVIAQNPYAGQTTEELKKQPRAPMSMKDIGRAGLASLVGSTGAIASAFGAETAPARGLREFAGEIQQGMTPQRQEEMRRREEIMRRAGEEGILSEISAGLGAVTEAPVQSVVSGLASSIPAIAAGYAGMVVRAPMAIKAAVALTTKLAVGALQGAGETKGSIFDTVTEKLMSEKGLSRPEAEAQATKAQEYLSVNSPGIMGSAVAGMLDSVTGVESVLGKAYKAKTATRPLTQPSMLRTGVKTAGAEALPESIQAGVGQVSQNVALQNAGIDTDTFSGVAGAAARDALMGALTGAAVSPLQMAQVRKDFEDQKQRRLNEEQAKIDEEIRKEEETLRQQQGQVAAQERAKEEEIVSAPPVEVKAPTNVHPIRNPLGNIDKEDLQQEGIDPYLSQHIDEYRKSAGLPPIESYSIEDLADAMPGVSPIEEQNQIDALLNARTGYQGERLTAQDVLDQAEAKQLTKDQAFKDFLTRTTGQEDLKSMSQSQLFAAFKSIQALPENAELEEGTNAIRFTDKQYNAAVKELDKIAEPVLVSEALSNIKLSTGLTEDAYAKSILDEAVRRGDVDRAGDKISPPTTAATLPEGYQIQEGMFERGEKPEGYQIKMGEEVLPDVYPTEEEANQKSGEVTKVQGKMFKDINNQIQQRENDLAKAEENLTKMQTAGQQNTLSYDKALAKTIRLRRSTSEAIKRLNEQLERLNPDQVNVSITPAKVRKVKGKGFTLFKDGKAVEVFKTRDEAERAILQGLPEEEIQKLTKIKGRRTLKTKAAEEVQRRAAPKEEPKVEQKEEYETLFQILENKVKPNLRNLLDKFGLKDVALNIEKDMKSDGEYSKSVIKVALDSANPVRVLRHESVHALKELGFFTPQQWKTLENTAKTKWIDTYLKGRNINGDPLEAGQQSRYDAYMNVYKGDQDAIIEEAIADAFGDFDMTKAPPGLMSAILKRLKLFFEALQNSLTGAGFQTYEDVFGKVERGELQATAAPTEAGVKQSFRATPEEVKQAEKYAEENGIMPYLSEGQLDIPVQIETKFSLKTVSKYDKYDDQFNLPLNKNGTVTLYYHTTRERAQEAVANKKITNDTNERRVYLTNESAGWKTLEGKGSLPQETDGTVIMVNVDPKLLNMMEEYKDGRKDFFIPTKEGAAFVRKMQLFSIVKDRKEAISKNVTQDTIGDGITSGLSDYLALTPKERKDRLKEAKDVLREEHNVANLLGENGKLEKTRIGDYGITYEGKSINSRGLGLASAQKINEKLSTCPRSAICEDLCLGETSGNNLMYGGAAGESYSGNIARSAFKAGPRMSQYLKTEALVLHPQEFAISLHEQIRAFVRKCERDGYQPAIRLNVTSDFVPKVFEAIIKANPDVVFYDYTKLGSDTIAPNHHLTYSSTGVSQIVDGKKIINKHSNWSTMRERLNKGQNVAMAFTTKEVMPQYIFDEEKGTTYQVWDGDNYDARFLDPKSEDGMGMIVGLSNKAATLKEANAAQDTDGFFVYYDPKVDGDTVTIKNQGKIAGNIPIKEDRSKKLSLRETPEFKQWFGDSKIVDKTGKPLVVYHTGAFDDNEIISGAELARRNGINASKNEGIYFTSNPEYSARYGSEGAATYPVYLSIQNPFVIRGKQELNRLEKLKQIFLSKKRREEAEISDANELTQSMYITPQYKSQLIEQGYDGIINEAFNEIVAFEPTQIKSATGNVGTFDKKNPDIRYSLRDTPQFKNWFGDSKIVNADGTPKVMYHGTTQDITAFKPRQANAIFVTDDPKFAESFSQDTKTGKSKGGNIMPVYVSAQNPFDYENPNHVAKVQKAFVPTGDKFFDVSVERLAEGDWGDIESERVQQAIRKAGFDGFYEKEGGVKNLAVYNPEQIKSATGNSGMYDKYNPDIRYNLRDTTDPSIRAAVDRVTTGRDDRTHAERITGALKDKDTWSNFRAQALNRYNRLADYDKILVQRMGGAKLLADSSAEAAALMSDLGAGLTASALGVHDRVGGIPVYKNGVTTVTNLNNTVKGPVAIFAPLSKYGDPYVYQLYQFWSGAKRGKRLLQDGREEVYTPAMLAYAQKLEKQYPEFAQIQKEWIKYNNGLVQFLVDTGVLSKDKADEFTRYSDYVPFYRQFDGENTIGPNLFASISGVKGPKKLKGGEAPLADFLETIVRNSQSSIQMGIKNVAAQRAAKIAVEIKEATRLNHVASGPDIFTTIENGKLTYYRSADQLFINAIKSLNIPDLPFIGLLSAPANWLRSLVTKDPGFILANMVRDSMSAYVTSGANMIPVTSTIANFAKSIANSSPEYSTLLNAGLVGGYEFSQGVKQSGETMEDAMRIKAGIRKGNIVTRGATGLWEALEKGTMASDAATRIEVYKATMAETGNEAEALFRAMEVMNFNRKGSSAVVRVLTAAVPFLNARMQGLDVLYRAGLRPTIQRISGESVTQEDAARQKTFIVRGMTMFALSCMYWAITHDDDEYKKQEQEVRDNNWLIPSLGIKIPIPFEVGILFKVIPERIMAVTFGDDTGKDFAKSMGRQLTSTLMFNPIPQTVLPAVEVITNHSFFTGRDIISQGMENIAPEYQVGPGTSLFAQALGQGIGASPMKIDHLIKGYTGTIGGYAVEILDMIMDLNGDSPKVSKRVEQMPFIKRFTIDPEARGTVTAFYELKDSVDQVTRTINLLERSGKYEDMGEYMQDNMKLLATKDYVLDLEKQLKELREMKNVIRNSQMSGDQKRDSILDIVKMENQMTSNMQALKKLIAE
jgi:hypothetical protein